MKRGRHGRVLPKAFRIRMKHSVDSSTATAKWSVYCEETHLRQVCLGTFFSGKLNCLVSWKRFNFATYKFKWQMSFFSLCDTFPCWHQKVKQILYFDKKNKNNKYAIFTFFLQTCLHYYYYFFLCDTLLCWQQNVKLIWFWTRRIK